MRTLFAMPAVAAATALVAIPQGLNPIVAAGSCALVALVLLHRDRQTAT